jgi:hypothetical protein
LSLALALLWRLDVTSTCDRIPRAGTSPGAAPLLIALALTAAPAWSGCGKGDEGEGKAEAKTTEGAAAGKKGGSVELLNVSKLFVTF